METEMLAKWLAQFPKNWFVELPNGQTSLVIPKGEEHRIPSLGDPNGR